MNTEKQKNIRTEERKNVRKFFCFSVFQLSDGTRTRAGFTLVELLLYMGLLSIFLVTLTDLLVAILDVKGESSAVSPVEQDGRYIAARLAYDVYRFASTSNPVAVGASTNNLAITVSGTTTTYYYGLNGTNLQFGNSKGVPATSTLNGSETAISGLSFQRIGSSAGNSGVTVQFTVTSVPKRTAAIEAKTFNYFLLGRP